MEVKTKVVLIAGCFDPIGEGHIDHILKAAELGTSLVIITHKDHAVIQKKKYCFSSVEVRKALLRGILADNRISGIVLTAKEDDLKGHHYKDGIGQTLRILKPDIFAKGGDRTPDNMPPDEIAACQECGIELKYGVGKLLSSSSKTVDKVFEQWQKARK